MADDPGGSASRPLPDAASLEWLRKQAKQRLRELRTDNPDAKLADAQFELARRYGFASWRALKAHIDSLATDGQLFDAVRKGDLARLNKLLRDHPGRLSARMPPYEFTLLHLAAQGGQLAIVDLLLGLGFDANTREKGDNTYAMHWAAAAGRLDIVRRLADAGGDVVGNGDDHQLEVIGWATCWDGCDDDAHGDVAKFLVSRGARHHIFSAIAMRLPDEVRRLAAADPSALEKRMSHNEGFQRPLHFAVRLNRPDMVALLLELGADPLGQDGSGYPPAVYAMSSSVDRKVLEIIARAGRADLLAALALGDWASAERWVRDHRDTGKGDGTFAGALHLMAKRGDAAAVKWLLDRGADANALWAHWDADVTPLHLAAWGGSAEVVRLLLASGADPGVRDSRHHGDALGWAEHFGRVEIVRLLAARDERA